MSKSQIKTMLISFFDIKGNVHFEFVPQGLPISHSSLLCGNTEAVTWNCAYKKAWTLAQRLDSSPWRYSSSKGAIKQFLAHESINEMEHPPCSPHLAPNDFRLFPKLKSALKGQRFLDFQYIQNKCQDVSKSYSTTGVPKMFNTVAACLG
jgi:hypothetical protein